MLPFPGHLPVPALAETAPPAAGVQAGRRPPEGLGLDAGEDGATLHRPGPQSAIATNQLPNVTQITYTDNLTSSGELDEDRYYCSMSSMYRIARAAGQTRERRRLATHPAKVKPELVATGPTQVWSWDITKLRGPAKGVWYHLYTLLDIYSRYSPHHIVCAAEDSLVAADFLDE